MTDYHRQCTLHRNSDHTTCWIPEKFAKMGKILRVKEDDGWVVTSIGARMESTKIAERSRDYLHQRNASDI